MSSSTWADWVEFGDVAGEKRAALAAPIDASASPWKGLPMSGWALHAPAEIVDSVTHPTDAAHRAKRGGKAKHPRRAHQGALHRAAHV